MRILVLGGAGFIGSNFVRHIINTRGDNEVVVYDKLTYAGRLENLHDILNRITLIRGDIADEELLERVVKERRPDIVVNFAAETHVDRSINEPAPFIRTNVLGTFVLLEVVRKLDIPLYVHISTDEVYGDLYSTHDRADEKWRLNPSSPYSASKASADLLIQAYGRTYGLRYRIVRPCNNYGPYQHPEKLIPRTIIRLLLGKPATIYGDGSQIRDWLYVGDFCRALEIVLAKGRDFEIYNVCADQFASVKEVVLKIVEILGKDPEKNVVHVRGRLGEDRRYAMRCDKIKELGWKPTTDLRKGLEETVKWYLRNKWWWEPLLDEYVLSDEPWRLRR